MTLPSPLELLAVVASALAVWLSVRRHVGTWPVSIVAVSTYLVVFVRARLYADAALQVVFLAQSVYGWWAWTGAARRAEPPVRLLSPAWRLAVAVAIAVAAWGVGAMLARHTDASAPYLDATASVTSLAANQLLARRVLENWLLWIALDVVYVPMFVARGLPLFAVLYAVFLVLAVLGYREWRRALVSRGGDVAGAR